MHNDAMSMQGAAAERWLTEGPWADLGTGSGAMALALTNIVYPEAQAGTKLPLILLLLVWPQASIV